VHRALRAAGPLEHPTPRGRQTDVESHEPPLAVEHNPAETVDHSPGRDGEVPPQPASATPIRDEGAGEATGMAQTHVSVSPATVPQESTRPGWPEVPGYRLLGVLGRGG